MALPALQQAMDEMTIFPPAFRFADAMELVQTVHDLNALIESRDRELTIWRANLMRNTREGFKKMEAAAKDLPVVVYAPLLVQFIDQALDTARDILPTFVGSLGDRPEMASKLREVNAKSIDGARLMRKMITRIDEVQKKQHDAYLFMVGVLREYRGRYEPYVSDGPSGANETAYLRSLNDRYSVVNAKLAQ